MEVDYKSMDIEKAIEAWNNERKKSGHDEYEDLYILDNDNTGLSIMFDRIYDALEAASLGGYDSQDDYIYQCMGCLYSFTHANDVTAPWIAFNDDD